MDTVHQTISLRDGRRVCVRTIEASDASARVELLRSVACEHAYTLLTPEEVDDRAKEMPSRIAKTLQRSDALYIVAQPLSDAGVPAASLVGDLSISGSGYRRIRHCGQLGMEVASTHRGVGLGDAMLGLAMAWARGESSGVPKLSRVELWVYQANTPALALYRKHGFVVEGTRRRAIELDGVLVDDHLMAWVAP